MSEVADRTGVTRQAVSNWASGSEGHSGNLKKLVKHLEIDFNEIASIVADISQNVQGYDPLSLRLNIVIERLNTRLQNIHEDVFCSQSLEQEVNDDWYFQNGFLKKYFKALFFLAFRDKSRGFDLAVVRSDSCKEEDWIDFCKKHVDDQTREISFESSLRNYFSNLSDVCRNYARIKMELDSICNGLDLAPSSKESLESEVLFIDDVTWENQFDYDRSNQIDYFFYWLSDRDGQEFFIRVFEEIKFQMSNNDSELCIFFHDALDRSVIENFILDWNDSFSDEETRQVDPSIFGDWNSNNQDLDPSRRMKDLGYFTDFENEEWRQEIAEEENWIAFVRNSSVSSQSRFIIPKACTLCAFRELMVSLGYTSKVKAETESGGIFMLSIGW